MKKKILVIDDEPAIQELMRLQLEQLGYSVISALTGNKGIKKIQDEQPDAVVLDVVLPDANGFDVCSRIRQELQSPVKIIMCTSKIEAVDASQARESGADDFVAKTADFEPIAEALANII